MATTGATTTYTYSETGSTNPSAPTSIGSGSLTYDTNGNLTAYNATKYTWDYRNRVTTIGNGTATTTFAYDHTFERVKKVSGGVSTYYINDLYNKAGATTTIYIYDNTGTLIATIEGNGTATTTEYQHQDHLGGTQVLTSAYGNVVSTLDYYPFGDTRISTGSFTSKRNFIGEVQDLETDLNYLNARYYDNNRGQFLSQDPVFWSESQNLTNPQSFNSYSYAENNPVNRMDPSGLRPVSKEAQREINKLKRQLADAQMKLVLKLQERVRNLQNSINPRSASTILLTHSFDNNPSPINVNSGNEQYYGNIVTKIQNSNDFKNYVSNQIKENGKNGTINVPANSDHSFSLNSRDPFTSLNRVEAGLSGQKNKDGAWDLKISITDTYNFEKAQYGTTPREVGIAVINNLAYGLQNKGVINTYPVNISFNYNFTP